MPFTIRHDCEVASDETLIMQTDQPFFLDFIISGTDETDVPLAKIGDEYILVVPDGAILFDRYIFRIEIIDDKNE